MSNETDDLLRLPSRVLGSLRPGFLTVIVGDGIGHMDGGRPIDLAIDAVPPELRMPNSKFAILMDRRTGRIVGVEGAR